jgi:hypothetical protein
MSAECIIRQPAGLGDILFTLQIGEKFIETGHTVIWPVQDHFKFLNEYLDTSINYCSLDEAPDVYNQSQLIKNDKQIFVPLQDADRIFPEEKILSAKYKMVGGVDKIDNWASVLRTKLKRNKKREQELENILNLPENFCLVSQSYGSPPNSIYFPMYELNTNYDIIDLNYIDGFNLFDWCGVIEKAKSFWIIESSINYLLEILDLQTSDINMYSRRLGDWSEIDYVFKKPYRRMN